METVCTVHGSEITSGMKAECRQCGLLVLDQLHKKTAECDRFKAETDRCKAETDRCKAETDRIKAQFNSIEEITRAEITIRNETASSAHTGTKHTKATHQRMGTPHVTLPRSFWNHRTEFKFPDHINGEPDINALLKFLIEVVIKALGIQDHLQTMLDVPIMDTAPDVSLVATNNKFLCGTVEGKKQAKTPMERSKIFGSDTEVAGEAFEQLYLVNMQNKMAVGLLSTLDTFQLIATEDISTCKLDPSKAKEFFASQRKDPAVTPDKTRVISGADGRRSAHTANKKVKVKSTAAPPKNKNQPKRGRVAVQITNDNVARKFFATDEISWGSPDENKSVFELLACYVLLCVKSLNEDPKDTLDLTTPNLTLLTRVLQVRARAFSFKQIKLPSGICFGELPNQNETVFYAIRQLGYGRTGACCIACTTNSAPCVVKFFRNGEDSFELAEKEAENWKAVYKNLGFNFVRAYDAPRAVLIMPFLRVPCNYQERSHLVKGGKSSLLYEALLRFAKSGFIHKEVFWHHVGLIELNSSSEPKTSLLSRILGFGNKKRSRDDGNTGETIAVFCDLGDVEKCGDDLKLNAWVDKSFKDMEERMGDGENVLPAIHT